MKSDSVEKVLRDHLRVKMGDLDKLKSEIVSVRNAIKAIMGTSSVPRASTNGHVVTCRGLTERVVKWLADVGPKTPQEIFKVHKAKDFASLKATLSQGFKQGKLLRTTNSKGFFEYAAPSGYVEKR